MSYWVNIHHPREKTGESFQSQCKVFLQKKGKPYKEITSAEQFDSYEEAEAYLLSRESENYKIVSDNPFASPVALEALKHYKLIYSSDIGVAHRAVGMVPEVKVFQYMGDK